MPSTLFIIVTNVDGAAVNPKGITTNSNCPYFVTKAVFGMSSSAIRTWK